MLYLVKGYGKNGSLLKIGFTDNWERRRKDYECLQPDHELLGLRDGDQSLETYFKRKLKKYRIKPRGEWMIYDEEIIDMFNNHFPTQEELQLVLRGIKSIPTREIMITIEGTMPEEVIEFSKEFNSFTFFTDKMKSVCNFLRKNKEECILYIPDPFKSYIQILGVDFIISVGGQKSRLDEALVKRGEKRILSKEDLDDIVLGYFQVGEKYTKAKIKTDLQEIYSKLGIFEKPTSTDIENWFEVKPAKIPNKETGKRDMGFEIISIK